MISLLVVNYHSAVLAAEAVASAKSASRHALHVVIVDNSCDASQAALLGPLTDVLITPERNLGYGAAINAGRRHCIGDVMIVTNPDVVFFDGAIDRLDEALAHSSSAVAGPALYWDQGGQWILPPSDLHTLLGKADEVLASRFTGWAGWRDRRRVRRRIEFWTRTEPTPVRALSGAVMAIRMQDFDAAGGFDERFTLYYEETDFLRRLSAAGRSILYVPGSGCRHVYNQSAGAEQDRAAALYAASEEAYYSKWYGARLSRTVRSLERPPAAFDGPGCGEVFELPPGDLVVEASPLPSFATAAGHFPGSSLATLPADVVRAYRGERLYLRAVDRRSGRVVARCVRMMRADGGEPTGSTNS